ncbi:hypothetical protein L1987_24020 [Smallanthus sonchifolius]|uniref:Uncharacterized protein n=1 Tax=Smallanthus sonchifolius TaxID=185202 RepID=A0ACB9IK63_9ASTR|nr:hypothetical protein L1987_24020 [Smallanthus sonchifolius]
MIPYCYQTRFHDCFDVVNDAIHGTDIRNRENKLEYTEFEQQSVLLCIDIQQFGWGFFSSDSIIFGSALVSFEFLYPHIMLSSKLLDSYSFGNPIRGKMNRETVLSDTLLYSWGGNNDDIGSCLFENLDSMAMKTLTDASAKCVSVDFVLLEQVSNGVVGALSERINNFVKNICDL